MARTRCILLMAPASQSLILDRVTGVPLIKGPCRDGIYHIGSSSSLKNFDAKTVSMGIRASSLHWHARLGHPSVDTSTFIITKHKLPLVNKSHVLGTNCISCQLSKSHRLPFSASSFTALHPLHYLYADVWGPSSVVSLDGSKYFVLFVDLFTRYCWLFPINAKSQVASIFPQFRVLVEKQFGHVIRNFYTDNGGEFLALRPYLVQNGISSLTTAPHTPQQNGLVERRNRHILEVGRALLHHAALPPSYWSFALQTAVYLINRMPSAVLGRRSPFQLLFGHAPNYTKLRIFGCRCFPWLRPYQSNKLLPPSKSCIFIGYSTSQSAYKCLDPDSGRIYVSRHVRFVESDFPGSLPPQQSATPQLYTETIALPVLPLPTSSTSTRPELPSPTPLHSVSLEVMPPAFLQPSPLAQSTIEPPAPPMPADSSPQRTHVMRTRSQNNIYKPKRAFSATKHPLPDDVEPSNVQQALSHPLWRAAMAEEFTALQRHGTWDLVPPPSRGNIIGCKWVFRIKRKPDGSVDKYKARLVAKGFHQRPGVDFKETFSPVVKPATIRTVLSLALQFNWPLRQLDVSNAFLHGKLDVPVFMAQPPGFKDLSSPSHVCLLRRTLYGLRQAPRAWYHALSSALISFGFVQSQADTSLFILHKGTLRLFVLVYVDDLIITGSSDAQILALTRHLKTTFAVKDLGPLSYFLGIEVAHCKEGLFLSQHKYSVDLLRRHKMDGAKALFTPMASTTTTSTGSVDPTEYRSAIGGLQYLTFTRPDIAFTVNKLAQHMSAPTATHWFAVKRLLRYLKGSLHHGLLLRRSPSLSLTAYSDSDFGGDLSDGKSTSAYIVFLGHNPISWRSRKQTGVARSSTEAEYRALAAAASEVCWLRHLFSELHIPFPSIPKLLCDNMGATRLALNPVQHSRMKHIAIDLHFVRDLASKGFLAVSYVNTLDQLADLLTKPLSRPRFQHLRSKISVADGTSILRGRINDSCTAPDFMELV